MDPPNHYSFPQHPTQMQMNGPLRMMSEEQMHVNRSIGMMSEEQMQMNNRAIGMMSEEHMQMNNVNRSIGIMTEEQLQVLQQQIAAFTAIQEQLCNWYLSSLSPPLDPNVNMDPNPYAHKLVRRSRWNPTPEQLEALERFGKKKMNPNKEETRMLAAELVKHGEITESNVYNWYQNRRARLRKKNRLHRHNNDNNVNDDNESSDGEDDSRTPPEQFVGDLATYE